VTTIFRKPYLILRQTPGTYVAGIWMPGTEIEISISATIQPAKLVDYDMMKAEQANRRIDRMVKVYTDTQLFLDDPRSAVIGADGKPHIQAADVLLYPPMMHGKPERYTIVGEQMYRGGMSVDHFRYLAIMEPAP
jgi:hypothetical protein